MKTNILTTLLEEPTGILGEGAVIERLRRNPDIELDDHIVNSAFIYNDADRRALETIYTQYLEIGHRYRLPLMLSTPTWRASQERIAAAGYAERDVNGDNFKFFDQLRKRYGKYAEKVIISGLMSCRGDAYNPKEALSTDESYHFHTWQANRLAESGVDFLLAATLPAISEATGLAKAMASTGCEYIISFIARPEGTLLDGTPLKEAIDTIDTQVSPKPVAYLINCTHASIFKRAILHPTHASPQVRKRIIGLLANTAALTPEELDNSDALVTEAPNQFGHAVAELKNTLGMKFLGGCCGTDDRHIDALAQKLAAT